MTSCFWNIKLSKIGNVPNFFWMALNTYWSKISPRPNVLFHFALWPALFKIQCCKSEKSEIHWMTSDWPTCSLNTLNSQKYPAYTKYIFPWGLKLIWYILLYDQPFPDLAQDSSLTNMLNVKNKKNRNGQNLKFPNFTILFNNSGGGPPQRYRRQEFWGVNLVCTFRGDVIWNFCSHMVRC